MSSTPVPSHLVLLQDLDSTAEGTKVRFLGCVDSYDIPTSTLQLRHPPDHPKGFAPSVAAHVDISLLVETVSSETIAKGTWVNVIGYVTTPAEPPVDPESRGKTRSKTRSKGKGKVESLVVNVQALMLWSAGAINVDAYMAAVRGRQEAAAVDRAVAEMGS